MVRITIKTLQQKVFQIDADDAETVADLKQKIKDTQGHAVEYQKLIYSGKVLADDKTIEACEIKEKDFLVLMVSKPKPTPTPPAASSSTTLIEPVQAVAETQSEPVPPPTAEASSPLSAPDGASFLSGDVLQTSIQNMVEMGFARDQVQRALRASFNNPDRAVEYLMNGIPDHLERELNVPRAAPVAQPAPGNPAPVAETIPVPPVTPASGPNVAQNLFQLAQQQQQQRQHAPMQPGPGVGGLPGLGGGIPNAAQLQNLRHLLAANPGMSQHLIQQIGQNNPQLAEALGQNPEALGQLLNEMEEYGVDGENALPPGAQVINVTEEERAAIERLEALGFPRHAVIEAYFACDKNEELAANYLFDSAFDDS